MALGKQKKEVKIKLRDKELQVEKIVYLGGLISKNGNREDKKRTNQSDQLLQHLESSEIPGRLKTFK